MKKRAYALVLCLILVLSALLTGCSGNSPASEYQGPIAMTDSSTDPMNLDADLPTPAQVSEQDFEVTEYLLEDDYGSTYFLVITNRSDRAVTVYGDGTAVDAGGNALGTTDLFIEVLGPGEASLGYFNFDGIKGIRNVNYSLFYDAETTCLPVLSALETETIQHDSNVTVTATNTSSACAEFVEVYALFFDANDNLIEYESTYLADGDAEIKPGKTMSAQLDCFQPYDRVEVYFTGRSSGEAVPLETEALSQEDFTVTEHLYYNLGATQCLLVITSHAPVPVSIHGNATALDSSGTPLGADDLFLPVLGPGETTLGSFFFVGVEGVADVEYELDYDTDPDCTPLISYLTVEQTVNDTDVILTVTNDNTVPAKLVDVHALFFDAQGQIIRYASNHLADNDGEIKPGETAAAILDAFEPFDHVEIYFTGRAEGGLIPEPPAE